MTNDPEAIRAALEPHGYVVRGRPSDKAFPFTIFVGGVMRESVIAGRLPWPQALAHFLSDKSQTGARHGDLLLWSDDDGGNLDMVLIAPTKNRTTLWEARRGMLVSGKWVDIDGARGATPDEAIAALWLKVKGLEDPRGDA